MPTAVPESYTGDGDWEALLTASMNAPKPAKKAKGEQSAGDETVEIVKTIFFALLIAMVLIAATFSLRLTRRGGTMLWASSGLFFGFLLYFLSDLVFALGLSARIPEVLAAWAPATVTMLLGLTSLLHLEDG